VSPVRSGRPDLGCSSSVGHRFPPIFEDQRKSRHSVFRPPPFFKVFFFFVNMEGNSVAASSSSLKIAWFISWISSRNVSMEVREVRVSSMLEFSLLCSISSSILLTVLCMVSFTFWSPKGVPCVFQVSDRLSHALVVSSILSRKRQPQPQRGRAEG